MTTGCQTGFGNPQDFRYLEAAYENRDQSFELVAKLEGNLWRAGVDHSPFDELAWQGNDAPYNEATEPLTLPSGETFVDDGDHIILHGYCERDGDRRIGFGECLARVLAARSLW